MNHRENIYYVTTEYVQFDNILSVSKLLVLFSQRSVVTVKRNAHTFCAHIKLGFMKYCLEPVSKNSSLYLASTNVYI